MQLRSWSLALDFGCQKTTGKIIKYQNKAAGSGFWAVPRPICVKRFDPASFPGLGSRIVLCEGSGSGSRSVASRVETARHTKETEFTGRAGHWKGGKEDLREF